MGINLAPVVLFVYNRPWHVRQTLDSLSNNFLADQSELIVFADGPKQNAPKEEITKITEVRNVVKEKKWCKSVNLVEFEFNKGLADSIIQGVTQIVNNYGRVIVLEDDLILSKFFLKYTNEALDFFENEPKVMHIAGHSFPLKGIKQDIYFLNYVSPIGWATWKNRWEYLEKDADLLISKLHDLPDFDLVNYNCGFGNEFYEQLIRNADKRLKTWAVKWHTSIFLNGGVTLFPKHSLIDNIGFDNSGEHCGTFKPHFSKINNKWMPEITDIPIEINKIALESFKKYYIKYYVSKKKTRIIKKIYGRLQSILLGRKKSGTNKA
jgi:hypothetical protein